VFEYVSNMEHLPEWSGTVTEVRQAAPGLLREGDKFTVIGKVWGWRGERPYEVTSSELNRRFSYWSTGQLLSLGATFVFEAVPEGTRLTQIQQIEQSAFLRLLEPFLEGWVNRRLNVDLVKLKDLLETRRH
jgi:hypothetical protein